MDAQKRTIRVVEAEREGNDHSHKRPRKIAISIDKAATNADLAREVATTFQKSSVILETSDGFELREQDGIDMIGENDEVIARDGPASSPVPMDISRPNTACPDADTTERFRITFVTAEHAITYGKQTPREQTEPTNGLAAYDGEPISGNTPLRDVKQMAAQDLKLTLDELPDDPCEHHHDPACACDTANEIERHGLSSTFHCRFTVDGTHCGNAECTYSHIKLSDANGASPPHCSICDDALGFPCPPCLARTERLGQGPQSVLFCPLVQNAGCGHLHHAHCVGPRRNGSALVCPSGCPVQQFPREAIDFETPAPYITIVRDGDKIEKIPVSVPAGDALITLTTSAVLSIVERFLEDHQSALTGLSLRMHGRDPVFETVRFARSTLVSVCPASSHMSQGIRRFPLFPDRIAPAEPPPASGTISIDLHTSHGPIVVCGCTPIKDLFAAPGTFGAQTSVILYVVERRAEAATAPAVSDKRATTVSKQSMYLEGNAWHPSVPQTPRGIAALLSSLYLFAHAVAQTGVAGEQKVLALAYAVLRFPPAIRTLAALILNKVPRPEEKAALAESLYHALNEFSARGPAAITKSKARRFETVRVLLAHLASAANADSTADPQRAVEETSLVCALSRKRLTDPVFVNSVLVERSVAALHQPGGALYRPHPAAVPTPIVELSECDAVRQVLPRLRGVTASVALVLHVDRIGVAPRALVSTLDTAARDFVAAIRRANQTDLVSQGPLELKSVEVIPPRIVVDQEGLLAVFTGRGCGTSRDVNFFRPTKGGDTEVDVNDVSHALQNVIKGRTMEDTWQVDSFGGVSTIARPPDEAIVLCLDLSESMNGKSGVQGPEAPAQPAADIEALTKKVVADSIADTTNPDILEQAKAHLRGQHSSCYRPWATLSYSPGRRGAGLLRDLATLASRNLVELSFIDESEDYEDVVLEAVQIRMHELACFVFAAARADMKEALRLFLLQLIDGANMTTIGEEPYDVPRRLVDFRTGNLLKDPVRPSNAPPRTWVERASKAPLEKGAWPLGHSVQSTSTAAKAKAAVESWVAGEDLLPTFDQNSKASIIVRLRHLNTATEWKLSPKTTTRTLYSLANRATQARYSCFVLKVCASTLTIDDATSITLDRTALSRGGAVEIVRYRRHMRQTYEFGIKIMDDYPLLRLILPQDSSLLAVLSYIASFNSDFDFNLTTITLWYGVKDAGDGVTRGLQLGTETSLDHLANSSDSIALEIGVWRQVVPRGQHARDASRHLTRLHLLKELFNVFLNRAGSFDTTVSLVLGLVTFSSEVAMEQELTPIFENFRQRLDRTKAGGDTAIYEALDSARQMLTQYRPDLANLRKRIIIVSDGEDTSSRTSPQEVCLALQRARVIVDSVQVGTRSDRVLHSISVATGGYRFVPKTSLADALSIFDLETMLYSGDRPPQRGAKPLVTTELQLRSYQNPTTYPIDLITVDNFPPRAEHPLLQKPVKAASTSVTMTGTGDDRMKRIMREIKAVVADPHPNIDMYFNDSDMSFMKVILEAPNDVESCPYKGGTFLLTCALPAGYPRDPPEVRFVTFIMHPNVSKQGKVCIAELGRLWSSDITLKEIFSLVYGTLLEPDLENPLEIQASLKYYEDDGTYALAVAEATAKHASKTRAQWKLELDT
ncbi:hypothetical protein C8R43DRAFT_1108121 [Mycena crocata]|nr:hypothetical protein C8R43DRAFT_1108121 [Mycena crocata]